MKKLMTLCLISTPTHILLGLKKVGFGQGRWNGFGGKVEEGESLEESVKREVEEEAGVRLLDVTKRGTLFFTYEHRDSTMEVHVFKATTFTGNPVEREKLIPKWFKKDELPFDRMWPDDRYWLPLFFAGKNFEGQFVFRDYDTITSYDVKEV